MASAIYRDANPNSVNEVQSYVEYLNHYLSCYPEISHYLPLTNENLLEAFRDGILFAYLVHSVSPESIDLTKLILNCDLSQLNMPQSKTIHQITNNINIALAACKQAGLKIVNIGAEDLIYPNSDLINGLLFLILRNNLLNSNDSKRNNDLIGMLKNDEKISGMMHINSEKLLKTWFNYHLQKIGLKPVENFSNDISDSTCYAAILEKLFDIQINFDNPNYMEINDKEQRAQQIINSLVSAGIQPFLTAKDIALGHPRLNQAFIAVLFQQHTGLVLTTKNESWDFVERIEDLLQKINEFEIGLEEIERKAENQISENKRIKKEIHEIYLNTIKQLKMSDRMSKSLEAFTVLKIEEPQTSNEAIELIKNLFSELIEEKTKLQYQLQVLAATLDQKEKINNVISLKIKEYCEDVIKTKNNKRR